MDLREQKNIARAGFQRHPWEIVRLEFVLDILRKIYGNRPAPSCILDVGCGDLYISKAISDYFPHSEIVSVDTAYHTCLSLENINVVNSLEQVPKETYPLILLLDVLEHIEDDREFLKNLIQRFSSPDTLFLITVPLHSFLFSEHDIKLAHKRRYNYNKLLLQIQKERLDIIRSGNLFSSLLLFRILQVICGKLLIKLRPGRKGASFTDVAAWNHSILLTAMVKWLLRFDIKYANRLPGLSGYVVASHGR